MKTVDIIIFGGQSNMQGQSERLSESEAVDGAFEYKLLCDELVPLKNPVGENIRHDGGEGITYTPSVRLSEWWNQHVVGGACYGHTNLVPEFCRAYIQKTSREVGAVHVAKGSTGIDWWLPGTPGYKAIVLKGAAAIKKASERFLVGHVYFVWLQGENDAMDGMSRADYKEKLRELFGGLSASLSIERFCIIRVGRFANDERDDEIINAQSEICREDEGFLMLTEIATELDLDERMMNPYVAGHFSAAGLEALGGAAGSALGEYVMSNYT